MRRKRIYAFECLEQKLSLSDVTPIPAPQGITTIQTPPPSYTDMGEAIALTDSVMSNLAPVAPAPITQAPNAPVAISTVDNFGNMFTVVPPWGYSYTVAVPYAAVPYYA